MLPRPTLSFVLPSIHDGLKLDCRIYHPSGASVSDALGNSRRRGIIMRRWDNAAVVAHPYAPMGGCYDDPVVDVAAGTLLRLGFLVATFNFRGATSSGGRTSWTSKPEQADYISVAGFLAHYVHHLDHYSPSTEPDPSRTAEEQLKAPIFLSAGYSYGAMIVARLPSLETVLSHFESPVVGSYEADIRLRAQHLAERWNALAAEPPGSPRSSMGIRMGDGVRDRDSERIDLEERIKQGVRHLLSRSQVVSRKHQRIQSGEAGGNDPNTETEAKADQCLSRAEYLPRFRPAYLVVSPPVGVVTNLATMSFSMPSLSPSSYWSRRCGATDAAARTSSQSQSDKDEADEKLAVNPSLVIYGDQDGFLSLRKMREWTRGLLSSATSNSITTATTTTSTGGFRYIEVSGAGHFWVEDRVMYRLRDAIGTFAIELAAEGELSLVY
ncbi:hypothetical protein F5Y16DRAFT_359867 [Xylariaceae sp. FL0255]|nr:hypothetical protein F5Y16DRAFT_359867 [Xylariaceae sp. FL0255]